MQVEMLQLSEGKLVRREEELIGGEEHGQEAMQEHTQPQQQQRLQEEPTASTFPAPWPPPLAAERDGKQGLEGEVLGLRGLT